MFPYRAPIEPLWFPVVSSDPERQDRISGCLKAPLHSSLGGFIRRLLSKSRCAIMGKSWENHGKIMVNNTIIIMAIFCNFMVELYFNNTFNILIDFFCFTLV